MEMDTENPAMEPRTRRGARRRLTAVAIPCCAIALVWYALTPRSAAEPPAAVPAPPAPFTQIAAHTPSATETFEALDPALSSEHQRGGAAGADASEFLDCLIQPSELVAIGSPVIGLIESIHVQRSDTIRRPFQTPPSA